MKKFMFSTVLFFTISFAYAQTNDYQIAEGTVQGQEGALSFTANIIGADEDFVTYSWQKFIGKHGGSSYLISSKEENITLESEHVSLPTFNGEEVTLHSRFTPNRDETGVLLTIYIEKKDGSYYSMKADAGTTTKIKDWLRSFDEYLMQLDRPR